jgi:twinkle protein
MSRDSSSKYIENTSCSECGSSDAVGVYEREDGTVYGVCYAANCGHYHEDPYQLGEDVEKKPKKKKDGKPMKIPSIDESDFHDLNTRGIDKSICEMYGVRSIVDEHGKDLYHFYPHTKDGVVTSYSVREVATKKFSWITAAKDLDLFGRIISGDGGKMIIVTEGVCDTLAAKQMLLLEGKNYRIVSLVNGASSAVATFKANYEWLDSFDNIFLAFDQDTPGQSVVKDVCNLFKVGKVKNITFSEKDANDMLLENKSKEFLSAIFRSKAEKVEGIVSVQDIMKEALEPEPESIPYPWPKLTEATLGYRRKELILIGAAPGAGKTQFVKEIAANLVINLNLPIGTVFLEESPITSLKGIAGLAANKRFNLPKEKGNWTDEELQAELEKFNDKIYLFRHFGAKGFDEIKAKVAYLATVLGIKDIFIDHVTALVAAEPDEYKALNKISEELASMAFDLDVTIFLISHLRKSSTGKSFSEGAEISTDSFRGSGSLISWSHMIFALSRDQSSEDEQVRNTTTLSILKSRYFGDAVGFRMKLQFNKETGRMLEVDYEDISEFDED